MPTIKLPEESEDAESVQKLDQVIRELSEAAAMTPATRALGLRAGILMVKHQELAHVMATRTLKNQQKRMIALAVASSLSAPYELVAHTRALQREYGMDDGEIVELVATIAHVSSINIFEKAVLAFNDLPPMRAGDPSLPTLLPVRQTPG